MHLDDWRASGAKSGIIVIVPGLVSGLSRFGELPLLHHLFFAIR